MTVVGSNSPTYLMLIITATCLLLVLILENATARRYTVRFERLRLRGSGLFLGLAATAFIHHLNLL